MCDEIGWGSLDRYPSLKKEKVYLGRKDLPPVFLLRYENHSVDGYILVNQVNDDFFTYHYCGEYSVQEWSDHKSLEKHQWSKIDKLDWKEFYTEEEDIRF